MSLPLWQSVPMACILLPLGSAALTAVLPSRWSRRWCLTVLAALTGLSVWLLASLIPLHGSFTYPMGHYPAPWGNELRASEMEAAVGLTFALVMLLSLSGGLSWLDVHIPLEKQKLYFSLMLLLCASLQAQVYTNDLFTAYVFVEIMTLSAAALIAVRDSGKALLAAARYMMMNLIGSALFLLGVILLYDLTGHLLMEPIRESVQEIAASQAYQLPMTVVIAVMATGLALKSALLPFHTWVPDAYSTSTVSSAAILSGLVSKGYIFLLIKVFSRVIGLEFIAQTGVGDVLFFFGLAGMILGSLAALRQKDARLLLAWSSVAQIGYIFVGLGLGTLSGFTAAVCHLLTHAAAKSLLFVSLGGLSAVSDGASAIASLSGSGRRSPLAGVGFTVGALSVVGLPFLGGFASKFALAQAAFASGGAAGWAVLACLVLSTLLNVAYFFRLLMLIWRISPDSAAQETVPRHPFVHIAVLLLAAVNLFMGRFASPLLSLIQTGLGLID